MKTQVAAALAALVAISACCGSAQAQDPAGANAAKFGVAVIDINFIFKNHEGFKAAMEGMKGDFQAIEQEMKGKQQQIVAAQQKKETFKPGSAEYKQIDEQIVRANASLQVEVTQKRKDLVEREAKIYYDTYLQVQDIISRYAQHKGIGLVLRYNGEDADPANRESILRSINKAVHFQNQVDITGDVLQYVNQNQQARATGASTR